MGGPQDPPVGLLSGHIKFVKALNASIKLVAEKEKDNGKLHRNL